MFVSKKMKTPEIVARKRDFAVVSRTHDMHRLAFLIRYVSKSRVLDHFSYIKASYPMCNVAKRRLSLG